MPWHQQSIEVGRTLWCWTTTIGRSSLRPRLDVAAANIVGPDNVLLGWGGDGRLDRSGSSLGGASDVGDVGGGRFA